MNIDDLIFAKESKAKEVAQKIQSVYRSSEPRPKWLLIENGEWFRLHKIYSLNKVYGNGFLSWKAAISHAFLFCFVGDDKYSEGNIHLYNSESDIPDFYKKDMEKGCIHISRCHKAYRMTRGKQN